MKTIVKDFTIITFISLLLICYNCASGSVMPIDSLKPTFKKQLLLPERIWRVPAGNNFDSDTSEFSYKRMVQNDNLAILWSKSFGADPLTNNNLPERFDVNDLLKQCNRFYNFYVDSLKFVEKGKSVTDKYKILMFVVSGNDGTAYGGGEDNKIGILWAPPLRINKAPYGAIAHELGHSFQYLVHANGSRAFTSSPKGSGGQSIFEMTSQYMLWQVEPQWIVFENYHVKDFLKQTHYAFLHEINQYHSPFVLEYWSEKHGLDFIGKLWNQARDGEDIVMAYKRITATSQEKFNDEMFDAARRFVTWDLKRIQNIASPYANQHVTLLDKINANEYRIAESNCPQNYGYNAIKLNVPATGNKIKLHFEGIAGAKGFRSINTESAGWRYGFVAVKKDGSRLYSKVWSKNKGDANFTIPANTQYLWLVVSGAPGKHWQHVSDGNADNDEQWPYQFKLTGTSPVESFIKH